MDHVPFVPLITNWQPWLGHNMARRENTLDASRTSNARKIRVNARAHVMHSFLEKLHTHRGSFVNRTGELLDFCLY